MEYLYKFFSITVVISIIIGGINYLIFRFIEQDKVQKQSKYNISLAIIFIILKTPENFGWITTSYQIYIYYKFAFSLAFMFLIARVIIYAVIELILRKNLKFPQIFYDILKGVLYFIAIMLLLKELGVSVNSIFTTSAILTAVIGLALQNTLSDIVAGIIISTEDTIEAGDWIDYNGKIGRIVSHSWRFTKVITLQNERYIIPNKEFTSKTMRVFSAKDFKHLFSIPFGVTYDNNPNKVIKVALEALKSVDNIEDPQIYFTEYGDFAILFEVRFYILNVEKIYKIKSDILSIVFYAFKREGIEIPIPRYDIFLREYNVQSDEDKQKEITTFINNVDFFEPLTEQEKNIVINDMEIAEFGANEYILKQNEYNNSFYSIKTGKVSVVIDDKKVATLDAPHFFGEISLMTGDKTTAAIRAEVDTKVYKLTSETFQKIFKNNKKLISQISDVITRRKLQNLTSEINKEKQKEKSIETKINAEKNRLKDKIKNFFEIK
ncbi:mechanosensitive ion channel family protein [bacterium]|nr:mechanosensitive ion channel family protein [bacterium]